MYSGLSVIAATARSFGQASCGSWSMPRTTHVIISAMRSRTLVNVKGWLFGAPPRTETLALAETRPRGQLPPSEDAAERLQLGPRSQVARRWDWFDEFDKIGLATTDQHDLAYRVAQLQQRRKICPG